MCIYFLIRYDAIRYDTIWTIQAHNLQSGSIENRRKKFPQNPDPQSTIQFNCTCECTKVYFTIFMWIVWKQIVKEEGMDERWTQLVNHFITLKFQWVWFFFISLSSYSLLISFHSLIPLFLILSSDFIPFHSNYKKRKKNIRFVCICARL